MGSRTSPSLVTFQNRFANAALARSRLQPEDTCPGERNRQLAILLFEFLGERRDG